MAANTATVGMVPPTINFRQAMIYGMGWGAKGAVLGAVALSWIPIGAPSTGGLVGGIVGY